MTMNQKDVIKWIIERENQKIENAEKDYWEYYLFALDSYWLITNFVDSIKEDWFFFTLSLWQIWKFSLLSIFSIIRGHKKEYHMNLRQVVESGCIASYSLFNNRIDDYLIKKENDKYEYNKKVLEMSYKWLKENHIKHNDFLLEIKKIINQHTHADIIWNWNLKLIKWNWIMEYFDDNDYIFETEELLRNVGSILINFFDMFYLINNTYNTVSIKKDFTLKFEELIKKDFILKNKLKELKEDYGNIDLRKIFEIYN